MNWMIPLVALSSGTIILMTALVTIMSSGDRSVPVHVPVTVRESNPSPEAGSDLQPGSLSYWSRRLLLPHYTECIQKPQFKAGAMQGPCSVLHKPTNSYYKWPSDEFRKVDKVTVDPSKCQVYVDDFRPPSYEQARLTPFDVSVRPQSTDHDVFLQVYCGGDFEFMKTLAKFMPLRRSLTFLDAGANIGLASVLFAHMMMSNGQVIAVDANPDTLEVAKMNFAALGDVVVPVQAAIVNSKTAAEKPSLTFTGQSNQYWGFRVDHKAEGTEKRPQVNKAETVEFDVPTKTLKQLRDMTESKVLDFIKLDIEGEEKYLLPDPESREVLCEAQCVFMELHERFVPGCNENFQAFMKDGCPGKSNFKEITRTGEYILICKEDLR